MAIKYIVLFVETPRKFITAKLSIRKPNGAIYFHPYFQWREKFYEQTNGAPMGSPLSPVMANLFMEEFEKKALATATLKPGFWFRYVDDTLSSWSHGLDNLQKFLDHINSLHPSIKFTFEVQKDDKTIPFLDVLFAIHDDGSLGHKVYRKPTHTDRYLHYNSFHHPIVLKTLCVRHSSTERKQFVR